MWKKLKKWTLPYDIFEVLKLHMLMKLGVFVCYCYCGAATRGVFCCCLFLLGFYINVGNRFVMGKLFSILLLFRRCLGTQQPQMHGLERRKRLVVCWKSQRPKFKNNYSSEQWRNRGSSSALSKLLEIGVKLDRLESLLINPPAKPILYIPSLSLSHLVHLCVLLLHDSDVYGCFINTQAVSINQTVQYFDVDKCLFVEYELWF